jgi:drug/metabolite transporter (DMT)-like permease
MVKIQSSETKAVAFGLTAVLLWSTVASAFKIALNYASPIVLLFGASCVSLIAIAVVLIVQGKFIRALLGLKTLSWRSMSLGLINPVFYYLILFEAYNRLPAQVAQPVNYTWAITLSLLSVPILGHKLKTTDWIGLLLGYGGVVIISIAGKNVTGSLDPIGLGLALLSTLLWAGYWLLNTKYAHDPIESLFHNFLISVPVLAILLLFWPTVDFRWHWQAFVGIGYVGLFEMGITFIFWQLALKHTHNSARIGTLIFISPFISLFLISAILKEPLQWQSFLGLGFIICGVVLSQKRTPSTVTSD